MLAAASAVGVFTEFREYAEGGFRMKEGDLRVVGARYGGFVDECATGVFGLFQLASYVVALESDVVDQSAAAILFHGFGDGAVRRGGFQKFDVDSGDVEHGDAHFLGCYFFDVGFTQSQRIAIVRNCIVKACDSDADVINLLDHNSVQMIKSPIPAHVGLGIAALLLQLNIIFCHL